MASSSSWSAVGKSQDDLMLKDECLAVNFADEVIGHVSKYNCHKFLVGQPTGVLHRAFSVLLFDARGRLLLQQRASSKITFPDTWTNTCCSHPLHGLSPSEVDDQKNATLSGNDDDPIGVKRAAVRKLKHELGIEGLAPSRFTYVTRVHYWACDVGTHGEQSPWGEHEIDYVLACKLRPDETLPLSPEPDEVRAVKWVSESELIAAMKTGKWSPWFKIIAERFLLKKWWTDLDALVDGSKFADRASIHRFDCHSPTDFTHGVGAGAAVPGHLDALDAALQKASTMEEKQTLATRAQREYVLRDVASTTDALRDKALEAAAAKKKKTKEDASSSAAALKQGAYGKVHTHATRLANGPAELWAGLKLKFLKPGLESNLEALASLDDDVAFCDAMLGKVSRSFAAVIRQLPDGVCLDICVFYLVLRALDTIEDDMEAFKGKDDEKAKRLRAFRDTELRDRACAVHGIGEGDEAKLLEEFGAVVRVLEDRVPDTSRLVIADVCQQMADGMADYVGAELAQGTDDVAAYDAYCHAVAGLVGEGLTRIFVARGFESRALEAGGEIEWPFCGPSKGNTVNGSKKKTASGPPKKKVEKGTANTKKVVAESLNKRAGDIAPEEEEEEEEKEDTSGNESRRAQSSESPVTEPKNKLGLANSMGLFLQKTNIIRDYLEDYVDGRAFWPKTVWRAYASQDDLGDFSRPTARFVSASNADVVHATTSLQPTTAARRVLAKGADDRALRCLNALIADALRLVPDALEYLRRVETPRVYRFCAIPQIMAIATLAECFDNPDLFTGVVKIRKGLTAQIILDTRRGHDATLAWFHRFAVKIATKLDDAKADAETKKNIGLACQRIFDLADEAVKNEVLQWSQTVALFGSALALAVGYAIKHFFFPNALTIDATGLAAGAGAL